MRLTIPKQYIAMPGEPDLTLDLSMLPWTDGGKHIYAYRLTVDGRELITGCDLRSAVDVTPPLHEMATTLLGFLSAYGESLYFRGEKSEYWSEHTEAQREFLMANCERLSLVAENLGG